ncbi:MAG: YidC/Oxa1 family membrane protein insertase [Gammaproteobacteria bacterium]
MLAPLLLAAAAAQAAPGAVTLESARERIAISLVNGLPSGWTSCAGDCGSGERSPLLRNAPGGNRLRLLVPGDAAATVALNAIGYTAAQIREGGRLQQVLSSRQPVGGRTLQHRYEFDATRRILSAVLQLPAGARLVIAGGPDLVPQELPGFGGIYSDARAIAVVAGSQQALVDEGEDGVHDQSLATGDWAGLRGRFWTLLASSADPLALDAAEERAEWPMLVLRPADTAATTLRLEFYGGPVAKPDLDAAAPELGAMLYAVLWEPLRWLSFGLQWLLDRWQDLVGRAWLAILLLSLSVKLLMAPLIMVAERWQADVNRTKSLLEPELAAIRREYKGEEAHERTLAVYRKHGVSHFYTFKSLAGFLIQIPVFIAAFDMLGENFRLSGESFLWIADLALPDRMAALPFVLLFFGGHLNLLPFVMTAFTVLAARWQEELSLSPELRRRERLRLYAMAAVFLVLLYTFPSGMVLYWTSNNFWHLLRVTLDRIRRREAQSRP